MEESRKLIQEFRHWKWKGSVLLLFCCHLKPRGVNMGLFYSVLEMSSFSIAWWESQQKNCCWWEPRQEPVLLDSRKPLCAHFPLPGTHPLAVDAHRDLDWQIQINNQVSKLCHSPRKFPEEVPCAHCLWLQQSTTVRTDNPKWHGCSFITLQLHAESPWLFSLLKMSED